MSITCRVSSSFVGTSVIYVMMEHADTPARSCADKCACRYFFKADFLSKEELFELHELFVKISEILFRYGYFVLQEVLKYRSCRSVSFGIAFIAGCGDF